MIKSEDISFSKSPLIQEGRKIGDQIIGRLDLSVAMRILHEEQRMTKIDLEEYAKERIRKSIWDKLYGELSQGLTEIGYHAIRSASMPHDSIRAKELYDLVNAKLYALMKAKP